MSEYTLEYYKFLCRELKVHNHLYFDLDNPQISDSEYDRMLSIVKAIELNHPEWIIGDSPLKKIGASLSHNRSVPHLEPMLSFDKVFSFQELRVFDTRLIKQDNLIRYSVESKIDGCAVAIRYKSGQLNMCLSRGDGFIGEDITDNVVNCLSIPKYISCTEDIEIRGEAYITFDEFDSLNISRQSSGLKMFANTRNCVSGFLRRLENESNVKVNFFAYGVIGKSVSNLDEMRSFLIDQGFDVSSNYEGNCTIDEVVEFINTFSAVRSSLNYRTDGVVVKIYDISKHYILGFTGQYYRWAVAFKFEAKRALCRLDKVVFQVGKTGAITPVALLDGVVLDGSFVKRASLHNIHELKEKDIKEGDFVWVEKRGDIIPYISSVDICSRSSEVVDVRLPTTCPSCGSDLYCSDDGRLVLCANVGCLNRVERCIEHFVSKGAMNIDGLGKGILRSLIQKGFIKNIVDVYKLSIGDLISIDGIKHKLASKILFSIERSKSVDLDRFIYALSIGGIGKSGSLLLSKTFGSWENICRAQMDDFLSIVGIGEESARSIYEFVNGPCRQQADCLIKIGVCPKNVDSHSGVCEGKCFVVTGSFNVMSRSMIERMITVNGGRVVSSVSSNVDCVVVGTKPGSKLGKAIKCGVPVLYEDEFLNRIGGI